MSDQEKPTVICPVITFLDLISNKWKVEIIWYLLKGKQRFGELRRSVAGISQKVLTDNLRDMERDGLLIRTVYAEVPPRVEYALSPLGESLREILDSIRDWSMEYLGERYPDKQFLTCSDTNPLVRERKQPKL
jgi:DNA-binding HxlR family transcriptional regulator